LYFCIYILLAKCHEEIMPRRQFRIDAACAVHHVIVRGIERGKVFRDNQDRGNFLKRAGDILNDTQTIWVYSEPGQGTTFKIYLPQTLAVQESAVAKSISSLTD
jgi:hypothetical protein